ncbi:MAG: TIR domain-containing protein [Paludibacteraceae bacterium]|nr:TIR domain-containing protein [Paludibacteraceae bacterium]
MEKSYDVFISYSRADYVDENKQVIPGNVVSQIKELLSREGISFWFDEEGIYSGQNFVTKIVAGIEDSKVLLFLSSENSNKSRWTCKEIATADELGMHIIPVRIDQTPYNRQVLFRIADLDYVEYYVDPEQAMQDVVHAIKTYLQEYNAKKQREAEKKKQKDAADELRRKIEEERRQLEEERKRLEEERRAMEQEARKVAAAREAERKQREEKASEAEEIRKRKEAQERRIAEAEAKRQAEERAIRKAEEEARRAVVEKERQHREEERKSIEQTSGIRICSKCGKQISATAAFCKYCGARFISVKVSDRKCPKCGFSVSAEARFCKKCGTKIV